MHSSYQNCLAAACSDVQLTGFAAAVAVPDFVLDAVDSVSVVTEYVVAVAVVETKFVGATLGFRGATVESNGFGFDSVVVEGCAVASAGRGYPVSGPVPASGPGAQARPGHYVVGAVTAARLAAVAAYSQRQPPGSKEELYLTALSKVRPFQGLQFWNKHGR